MTVFFKPYEGRNPYIFVSYSHRDSEAVIETIRTIHEKHYRLWYDEGIPAGSDWPRNIAVHMRDCRMVLFFLSRTALESPNCLSEITTAARQKKTILLLPLEEIPESGMSSAWQDCLREAVRIAPDDLASGRTENILRAPQMTELGFTMEKIRQGPFTWTYPMKLMKGAFEEHRIVYQNNPVLRWCLMNTAVKTLNKEGIESIQPVKSASNRRIDGMVSLLNAWTGLQNHSDEIIPYLR